MTTAVVDTATACRSDTHAGWPPQSSTHELPGLPVGTLRALCARPDCDGPV